VLSFSVFFWSCKKPEAAAPADGGPRKLAEAAVPAETAITPKAGPPLPATTTIWVAASKGLHSPRGMAVDSAGNGYIGDTGNSRVVKVDPSGKQLVVIGAKGTRPGQFLLPVFTGLSKQGELLVLDSETSWVQVFTPAGKYLTRVGGSDLGLYHPAAFSVLPNGALAVVDTGGNRVVLIGGDGKLVGSLIGDGRKPFVQPSDIYADSSGGLHVYQAGAPSVYNHFGPDQKFLNKWVAPNASSTLDSPRSALAPDGRLFVTDPQSQQIRVYDATGATYRVLHPEGDNAASFRSLTGIALDSQGRLYVLDGGANVVYRLQLAHEATK
jgi:sugar lactone lactonase YvrE